MTIYHTPRCVRKPQRRRQLADIPAGPDWSFLVLMPTGSARPLFVRRFGAPRPTGPDSIYWSDPVRFVGIPAIDSLNRVFDIARVERPGPLGLGLLCLYFQQPREEAIAARLRDVPREPPSPVAIELTESVMLASTAEPPSFAAVRASLIALAEFLASAAGRTHTNCVTVSRLLDRVESWRRVNRNRARWQYLPEEYRELLTGFGSPDMTLADPEPAEEMETTPEQLLSAARALRVVGGAQ